MVGKSSLQQWILAILLPVLVNGGQHFTSWLADIVADKGVDQFQTDYRWTEISAGGGGKNSAFIGVISD